MRIAPFVVLGILLAAASVAAQATVPQPAESAAEGSRTKPTAPTEAPSLRSYEAPPVYETVVTGSLWDEQRIGSYAQPRWTAARRFPTTRIYVMPAGTVQAELWQEIRADLSGEKPTRLRNQYELEMGLGHRLQLDFYFATQQFGIDQPIELFEQKVELRYALARWGAIPTNPTLYFEFVRQNDGPPALEVKLLLGDQIRPRWHWGANLVYERELTGDEGATEYVVSGGISYTLRNQLSVGAEAKFTTEDTSGRRLKFDVWELLAGPSIQWRPLPPLHLDLVTLFGAEVESPPGLAGETTPIVEALIVVGWEF
jgi:hypothetical protein